MPKEICLFDKDINNSKLLALFNTLAENDKDIIINMAEFLVYKLNIINKTENENDN